MTKNEPTTTLLLITEKMQHQVKNGTCNEICEVLKNDINIIIKS